MQRFSFIIVALKLVSFRLMPVLSDSKRVASIATWIPGWEEECINNIRQSLTVSNSKVCEAYVNSCASCCLAGYDTRARKCHLLTASPKSSRSHIADSVQHDCLNTCGTTNKVVKSEWNCSLNNPANGGASYVSPREAIFSCQAGYYMRGRERRTCFLNGSWDVPAPTCEKKCANFTGLASGNITYSGDLWPGDTAVFTCKSLYHLTSDGNLTCLKTGTWDRAPPLCECATGWERLSSRCVHLITLITLKSADNAVTYCNNLQAIVITFRYISVTDIATFGFSRRCTSIAFAGRENITLPGKPWFWPDGTKIENIPWKPGEPNSNVENAMVLRKINSLDAFIDVRSWGNYTDCFICEEP